MSASVSSDDEVRPGDQIGRYTVLRRLATGGMAEIYLARQDGPKGFTKLVVLKRVLTGFQHTEKFVEMFLDEGRLSARLSHPNIAQTFELGEHDGNFHLAMEYVPGESLARLVKRAVLEARAIGAGALLRIGMQVLEALDYAHDLKGERGEWLKVVHRDVSPTNVIISYHGSVKLLDFGIARAASHQHETQIGTVKGKGGYMSPEQAIAGPVDQRTDVYAAGALLYLLTTGVGPFDDAGNVFAMMQAAVEARFPKPSERNRGVDPQLEKMILKAMATRPEDRYPTAGAMLAALETYAADQRISAGPRELATLMRQLFPERAELARSYDQAPDAAMIDKLAQSFVELDSEDEVISAPTRFSRRPGSKPEDIPAPAPSASSMDSIGTDQTVVPSVSRTSTAPQLKTPTGTRPVVGPRLTKPDERVVRPPQREGPTVRLPSLPDLRPTGPVPTIGPPERDTTVVASSFIRPVDDDLTEAHAQLPPQARTISAEHSFASLSSGSNTPAVQEEESSIGTRTEVSAPITYQSVADIVSRNPWAFVGAGLGAVFLGVALLWILSS